MKEKISVKELMRIEKVLLEYRDNHVFELEFNTAYKLQKLLDEIGDITNYVFSIQDKFYNLYKDKDKLIEYHKKIIDSKVEFDLSVINDLIERLYNEVEDENIKDLKIG